MNKIEIYSTDICPWCRQAKALFSSKGLDFEEINITSNQARAIEMIERSGRRTVPQIFIDGKHIGGFDDLSKLDLSKRSEVSDCN